MKMFLGVLLIAGAAVGFVQQRKIGEAQTVIESQKDVLAETTRLRLENNEIKNKSLSAAQVTGMRADRAELMRLRASLPELRIAAQSPEQIEVEIKRLNESAARDYSAAKVLQATYEAEQYSKAAVIALQSIGYHLQDAKTRDPTATIRSFEELKSTISSPTAGPSFDAWWEHSAEGTPPFNISRNHFEFIPETASRNGALLVRERQPRRLPDGTWARLYLTSNYRVTEQKLPDGDFAAWELNP